MDDRLLQYYDVELHHVRRMAAEFARAFPKVAARLDLAGDPNEVCPDPWVERLLEGFAFLAARVHLKLDAEFPRFTHSLLETVYPHYLAPTPSMAIVQFQPDLTDDGLADGFTIPRQTVLRGKGDRTKVEYRTAHDVKLAPLQVVEAEYHTRDIGSFEIPGALGAKAGVRVRLETTAGLKFSDLKLDDLTFHLVGSDETPMVLYEQCLAQCVGAVVQTPTRPPKAQTVLAADCVQRVGYDEADALLPYDARSFHGYRLLREYFALPRRFLFVRLAGIREALQKAETTQVDLFFLFKEENLELEDRVEASNFALHCTPVINLFPRRTDPVSLTERFAEHHIVPDRLRPMDFEIYRVERITGIGTRASEEQEFRPFYSASDFDPDRSGGGAYYVTRRVPRTLSSREREKGRRSNYAGSEVYVTLVDGRSAPYRSELRQLSVQTLCTNRDLAVLVPVGRGATDFSMDTATSAPVTSVRCIGGRPSRPMPSHAEGEFLWRAISHLSLNYLSLADTDEKEGAAALRDLLRLYADPTDAATRQEIDGIRSIRTSPITRPVPAPGPITFARGLEVELTFDERAFTGTGVFLLGAVLAEFFTRYVSMNSFTETVVTTLQRPEVKRWRAKIGQRQML